MLCFELYFKNYECLIENLSNYENYKLNKICLSNENETKDLFIFEDNIGNNSLNTINKNKPSIKIKSLKLDHFNLTEVDYIKIDVQMHEYEALEGSLETLKNNNPFLCVECDRRT